MRYFRGLFVFAATTFASAALAGSALAQTPAGVGYGGQGGVLGGVQSLPPSGSAGGQAPAGVAAGTLPFTGFDLVLLVGGGLVVAAIGAGLVRVATQRTGS